MQLLSTHTDQRGEDNEGILGFLEKDIRKSIKIARNAKCIYCKKFYAAVYCSQKSCKNVYHYPCGYSNLCLFQFENEYKSYCHEHLPAFLRKKETDEMVPCLICLEYIEDIDAILRAPSCCNDFRFHRKCLMEYASSSGYLFSCVKCHKRTDKYVTSLRMRGIYVPDEDASWEIPSDRNSAADAFSDLLYRPSICMAAECKCPKGREYRKKGVDRNWHLEICRWCGSKAVHRKCIKRTKEQKDCLYYECDECAPVVSKPKDDDFAGIIGISAISKRARELSAASVVEPSNTDNATYERPNNRDDKHQHTGYAPKRYKFTNDSRSKYTYHVNSAADSPDSLLVEMHKEPINGASPLQSETDIKIKTDTPPKSVPMQDVLVELSSDSDIDCTEVPYQSEFNKVEKYERTPADVSANAAISEVKTPTLREIIETNGEVLTTKFENDQPKSESKANPIHLISKEEIASDAVCCSTDRNDSVELVIETVTSINPDEFAFKNTVIANRNSGEIQMVSNAANTINVYNSSSESDNEVFSLKKRQTKLRYKSRAPRKIVRQTTDDSD